MNKTESLALGAARTQPAVETRSFWSYYFQAVVRPGRTFQALLADRRRLAFGLAALGISAALYTVVYIGLTIAGGAPTIFDPWLAIPKDVYFHADIFILAPSMFAGCLLAAGLAHLLSKLFGGAGSFDDTLALFGFGVSLATWATGIHELTDSLLGAAGIIDVNAYEAILNGQTFWHYLYLCLALLYLAGLIVFFAKGLRAAQKIRPLPAALLGLAAAIAYQFFFFIFNR
jgi:hypothetical protein